MRKNRKKILLNMLIFISIISIGISVYAHSGRTDSRGGHKDNNNKSGLGSYHYHCGGHPAHLHTNGGCPYSSSAASSSSTSKASGSTSNSSSTKPSSSTPTSSSTTVPTTIVATGIVINENIANMKVGEKQKLTATITPSNVTDKNITWKSSDESVATVNSTGEVIAKKAGIVDITASTSNGKVSTVKINIKEEAKVENKVMTNTSIPSKNYINNNTNNTISDDKKESNPLGKILLLGLLCGGGYLGYKNLRK